MSASPRPLVDDTADVVPVYCTARAHIALVLLLAGMTPAERKACSRVCRPWRAAASDPAAWASLSAEHREFCTAAGAASERAAVGDCDFCAAASAAADKAAAPTELMMDYRRSHARRNLLSSSKCKSAVANLALTKESIFGLLDCALTAFGPHSVMHLCACDVVDVVLTAAERLPPVVQRAGATGALLCSFHQVMRMHGRPILCRFELWAGTEVQLAVQPVPLLGCVNAALSRACRNTVCAVVGLQARPDSTLEAVLPRLRGVLQLGCGDVVQNSDAAGDAAATLDAPGLLGGFESVARAEWAYMVELQQTMATTEAEALRQTAAAGMQACEQVAASAAELAEQEAHMHALAASDDASGTIIAALLAAAAGEDAYNIA